MLGIKGWSAKKIVTLLNKELQAAGKPNPPRGKYWNVSTILGSRKCFRGIINNELYRGRYIWNKTSHKKNAINGSKKTIVKLPDKWTVIEKPELKIIPDFLWETIQKRLKQIRKIVYGEYTKTKHLYSKHLLTKVAKCGNCGGTFGVVSGGKYKKYGCTTNWNKGNSVCSNTVVIKKIMEEAVVATLYRELAKKDPISLITEEIQCNLDEFMKTTLRNTPKTAIKEELNVASQELENISRAITKGIITETTEALLRDVEMRKKRLENQFSIFLVENIDDF